MPRIIIDVRFDIGDRVCWESKGTKISKCDKCGTELVVSRKARGFGEICGWEAIEYGTMGIDIIYMVEPDSDIENVHSYKRLRLPESRLSHAKEW